jgi:hypothetical protein
MKERARPLNEAVRPFWAELNNCLFSYLTLLTVVGLFLMNEMPNLRVVLKFTFLKQSENSFRFYMVQCCRSYKQNGMEAKLLYD